MCHTRGSEDFPRSYCFVSLSLDKGRGIHEKQSLPGEGAETGEQSAETAAGARGVQTERRAASARADAETRRPRQCGGRGARGQADRRTGRGSPPRPVRLARPAPSHYGCAPECGPGRARTEGRSRGWPFRRLRLRRPCVAGKGGDSEGRPRLKGGPNRPRPEEHVGWSLGVGRPSRGGGGDGSAGGGRVGGSEARGGRGGWTEDYGL